jgi:hypothetical protein
MALVAELVLAVGRNGSLPTEERLANSRDVPATADDTQAERRRAADRDRKRQARAAAKTAASADISADIPQTSADPSTCSLFLSNESNKLEERERADCEEMSADASADVVDTPTDCSAADPTARRLLKRARSLPSLPLPADWKPSEPDRAHARAIGLTDESDRPGSGNVSSPVPGWRNDRRRLAIQVGSLGL